MIGGSRNIFHEIIFLIGGISLELALKILDIFIVSAGISLIGIMYILDKWSKVI